MGFEKLIDFIISLLSDFMPFYVVNVYEKAVVLRFGRIYRIKDQGFYWKIPFVDNPLYTIFVTTTIETPVQTLSTKDGKTVSVKSVVKYNIQDVQIYTESIYDATDAIVDLAQGHIMTSVNTADFSECQDITTLSNTLTKKLRNEVKKYGIYIEQQTVTNFIETSNIRLFNESNI